MYIPVSFLAAYGMVPFIQVVLATMLPMLGMAKQDNLRWVFANSKLVAFSDPILRFIVMLSYTDY